MADVKSEERKKLIHKTVNNVLEVSKYESLYEPTVRRIVEQLVDRYPVKKLEKAVRKQLHRIWGAYFTRPDFDKLFERIEDTHKQGTSDKEILWDLLRLQTSTDERLEIIHDYYKKIFDITGVPDKIAEYGCGVNALTYPWMEEEIEYVGFDVDKELIKFINNVFKLLGYTPKANVRLGDVLIGDFEDSDITLLLKVLILFERQVSGVELDILRGIPSRYIVVSYPTQSISGKRKGMVEKYRSDFYKLVQAEGWLIREILFSNEIIFIIEK